jgi:hypothetical protein
MLEGSPNTGSAALSLVFEAAVRQADPEPARGSPRSVRICNKGVNPMAEHERDERVTVVETRDGGSGGTVALVVLVLLVLLALFLFRDSIFGGAAEPTKVDVDITSDAGAGAGGS